MSSLNYFETMRRHNEIIYHHAPYSVEALNDVSPAPYSPTYLYNYEYTPIEEVPNNNFVVEIWDLLKFFLYDMLFLSFLSFLCFLGACVQPFLVGLYNIIAIGFYLLPHRFPIFSSYPFPYSLWVFFLWILDFLDLIFVIIFIPTFTVISYIYMFIFDLIFIPFREF
jgi:hypothetical protein